MDIPGETSFCSTQINYPPASAPKAGITGLSYQGWLCFGIWGWSCELLWPINTFDKCDIAEAFGDPILLVQRAF